MNKYIRGYGGDKLPDNVNKPNNHTQPKKDYLVDNRTYSDKHDKSAKLFWKNIRTVDIKTFCDEHGFTFEPKTEYQFRVNGVIDLYPTNGKWHFLPTNKRGDYHTIKQLENTLLRLLEIKQ